MLRLTCNWCLNPQTWIGLIKSCEVRGKGDLTCLKYSKIQANLDVLTAPGLSASSLGWLSPRCSANQTACSAAPFSCAGNNPSFQVLCCVRALCLIAFVSDQACQTAIVLPSLLQPSSLVSEQKRPAMSVLPDHVQQFRLIPPLCLNHIHNWWGVVSQRRNRTKSLDIIPNVALPVWFGNGGAEAVKFPKVVLVFNYPAFCNDIR